jgi:hypothetical protein
MASRVQLFLRLDGNWKSVLSVPADQIPRFTTSPLKWLRFLAYAIYGCEGRLYDYPGGSEVDYTSDIQNLGDCYYFVSPGMFIPLLYGRSLIFVQTNLAFLMCMALMTGQQMRIRNPTYPNQISGMP